MSILGGWKTVGLVNISLNCIRIFDQCQKLEEHLSMILSQGMCCIYCQPRGSQIGGFICYKINYLKVTKRLNKSVVILTHLREEIPLPDTPVQIN